MKKEEEKMLLQNEKTMMKQLKKDLEKEEVPLEMYPSMVKERLKKQGQKTKTKKPLSLLRRVGFVMGMLMFLLVCKVVLEGVMTDWSRTENEESKARSNASLAHSPKKGNDQEELVDRSQNSESGKILAEKKVTVARSYEQLFEIFKEQGKVREFPSEEVLNGTIEVAEAETTTTGSSSKSYADSEAIDYATGSETSGSYRGNEAMDSAEGTGEDASATNVQEQGVDEGDIIKTDGTFLFILQENENAIRVVKANQGAMSECHEYVLDEGTPKEMYVSDGILTVIMEHRKEVYYDGHKNMLTQKTDKCLPVAKAYVTAENLKVREDGTLESLGTVTQDGFYHSSRKMGGIVYVFTQYRPTIYQEDGSLIEEYIPKVNGTYLEADCIAIPKVLESDLYVVCSSYKANNPRTIIDTKSILTNGYSETLYVSETSIYITNTEYFWEDTEEWDCRTEITKYNYKDGVLTPLGHAFVPGHLLNSFSMDENEGYLRLVTTGTRKIEGQSEYTYISSNQLYVLDETMERVGSIENIAEDESIQSARFMGDVGYFVTYKNIDPLFSVDFSDPANPKIMDALKIPGFSSYLHFYSDHLLFGFGQETDSENGRFLGMKLSMFDISNPYDVQERHKFVIEDGLEIIGGPGNEVAYSEALYNHKAMLIHPQKNIVGFPIELSGNWDSETEIYTKECSYVIFGYGEEGFYSTFHYKGECDRMRGLYIGDILYICEWDNEEGEVVHAFDMTANFAKVGELVLKKEYTEAIYEYGCAVCE